MTVGLENMNKWSYDLLDTFMFPWIIIPFLLCSFNFLNYVLSAFWWGEKSWALKWQLLTDLVAIKEHFVCLFRTLWLGFVSVGINMK